MDKKIHVLAWCDSPAVSTGFATVARGILNYLASTGKYDIDIIGINDRGGWKNPSEYPYRIYPAVSPVSTGDYHGRPRVWTALLGKDPDVKPPWDLIFTLNDPFILEETLGNLGVGLMRLMINTRQLIKEKLPPDFYYKIISYYPVDSMLKGNWVENAIALSDYPVMYTQYGVGEVERAVKLLNDSKKSLDVEKRLQYVYHGIDPKIFFPIEEKDRQEFRKVFFKGLVSEDKFLVVVVARNQIRKDLPRTFKIFKEFQKRRPDSFLYIHAQLQDAGGNLMEYARNVGLEFNKDWGVPKDFNASSGFRIETLNMLYNAADCILSTTHGEGWGFYLSEGMRTKRIVIAPDNTVHPEILGYTHKQVDDMDELLNNGVRGVPVKAGSNNTEWISYGAIDLERYRPVVNVEDAVKKLMWVYDNPEKVKIITDRAFDWINQFSWDAIGKQWDKIFTQAYADLKKERAGFLQDIAKKSSAAQFKSKRS